MTLRGGRGRLVTLRGGRGRLLILRGREGGDGGTGGGTGRLAGIQFQKLRIICCIVKGTPQGCISLSQHWDAL